MQSVRLLGTVPCSASVLISVPKRKIVESVFYKTGAEYAMIGPVSLYFRKKKTE